ncbi:MAG: aminoacyl-tRNA hydrolase [Pseudomonadota bacterium]
MSAIKLIVGLGNPGPKHEYDRHNAGFWFVEALARLGGAGAFASERKFLGDVCQASIATRNVRLLKPTTFMNRSGQSVRAVTDFYKIDPGEVLVAHDELDLPPGTARLKRGGGHGGHNGLRDLIAHLGKDFMRLRLGIGHPGSREQVVGFVLKPPGREEAARIDESLRESLSAVELLLRDGEQKAMNQLHSRANAPTPAAAPGAKSPSGERRRGEGAAKRDDQAAASGEGAPGGSSRGDKASKKDNEAS